jgi:hypothetical protein
VRRKSSLRSSDAEETLNRAAARNQQTLKASKKIEDRCLAGAVLMSAFSTILGDGSCKTSFRQKWLNRAGSTIFVAPDLMRGTLDQGFKVYRSLATRSPACALHDVPNLRSAPLHWRQWSRCTHYDERRAGLRRRTTHCHPNNFPGQLPSSTKGALESYQRRAVDPRARFRTAIYPSH